METRYTKPTAAEADETRRTWEWRQQARPSLQEESLDGTVLREGGLSNAGVQVLGAVHGSRNERGILLQ